MEYKKLVEALRSRIPIVDNALLDQAADAIENLQNAVRAHSELGNRMSNLNFGLVELILQADAAVGAAEEKIQVMKERFKLSVTTQDPCEICVGYRADSESEECEQNEYFCRDCKSTSCRCKECRDMDKWDLKLP